MDKLPLPALLAAVLITGIYGWLRQPPTQELGGMFIVSAIVLLAVNYIGKWGLRRWTRKSAPLTKKTT